MKNCIECDKPLFGAVTFCPFCGTATGALPEAVVPPSVVAAATAAADAAPPKASAPVQSASVAPPSAQAESGDSRKKPAASAPVKPPREARAQTSRVADTTPSSSPPKPNSSKKKRNLLRNTLIGVAVVGALLAFIGRGSDKQDNLCNQQIDEGTQLVQSGDLAGASAQSKLAGASCTGALAAKATQLQTLLTSAQTTHEQCTQAYDAVTSRLRDGRLSAAISGLNQLPLACAGSADASQIKEQVEQASTAADAAEQKARTAIAAGDAVAAAAAIDDLAQLDRFRPILPALRAQLASIPATKPAEPAAAQPAPASVSEPAPAIATQPAMLPPTQPPAIARPAPQYVQPAVSAFSGQAAAAQQFLNDAQTALEQSRFDAAKTYIDSARRMDPNNPRIDALARVVRDREHEVLQDETTIK